MNHKEREYNRTRYLALEHILGKNRMCDLTIEACDQYRRDNSGQHLDHYVVEYIEKYLNNLQSEAKQLRLFSS